MDGIRHEKPAWSSDANKHFRRFHLAIFFSIIAILRLITSVLHLSANYESYGYNSKRELLHSYTNITSVSDFLYKYFYIMMAVIITALAIYFYVAAVRDRKNNKQLKEESMESNWAKKSFKTYRSFYISLFIAVSSIGTNIYFVAEEIIHYAKHGYSNSKEAAMSYTNITGFLDFCSKYGGLIIIIVLISLTIFFYSSAIKEREKTPRT